MTATITAFAQIPPGADGLARDFRVRWAMEEVGVPYAVHYVPFGKQHDEAQGAGQPFGQIPSYREGDLVLFESGAIVLHIATKHPGLLPEDGNGRARAIAWMFAAVDTVEKPIWDLVMATIVEGGESWAAARKPLLETRVRGRLADLSGKLGDAEWLEGSFSAGDIMMIAVLRILKKSGIVNDYPNLAAYVARGEARPAFRRAIEAQVEGDSK